MTIDDLVRYLGHSKATISLALNDSPLVADSTKSRVQKAAKQLGYRPNYFAARLSRGRSEMIGLFILGGKKEHSNWVRPSNWLFYNPILRGITSHLSEVGYRLRLEIITVEQAVEDEVLAHTIQENSLDGILLVVEDDIDYGFLDIVEATKFPMVILNGRLRSGISSIKINNELGARKVVEHLVELGHKKIAHIAGPETNLNAIERKTGFIDAIFTFGLELDENRVKVGDWQIESGRRLAKQIMEEDGEITAIFCANDHMAVGAIQSLGQMGIRVPEDVSIVGFDDVEMCEIITPSLTSVRQSLTAMGLSGTQEVLRQIEEGCSFVRHSDLEPELIVRQSTTKKG